MSPRPFLPPDLASLPLPSPKVAHMNLPKTRGLKWAL